MKRNQLTAIPIKLHARIKKLAKEEETTIMHMIKMMVDKWEKDNEQ